MDKIDIRDLRVGDWVYSSFSQTPCKVTEIRLDESGYGVCKVTGVDGYKDISSLSPIPLTAEILKKNGFKRISTSYELEGTGFVFKNPSHPDNYMDNYWLRIGGRNRNIRYVHELQHTLKLCGIEKEITIENDKIMDYKEKYEIGSIVTAKRTYNGETITGEFGGFYLQDKSNPKSIVGVVHTTNSSYDVESNSIEYVISEDERIRKQILDCFRTMKQQGCFPLKHKEQYNYWIAWLERQGDDQKPAWSEEDTGMIKETLFFIEEYQKSNRCVDENCMQNSVSCEKWLKSIKKRMKGE